MNNTEANPGCEHCFNRLCDTCQVEKMIHALAEIRNETIIWLKDGADDTLRKIHHIAVDALRGLNG